MGWLPISEDSIMVSKENIWRVLISGAMLIQDLVAPTVGDTSHQVLPPGKYRRKIFGNPG
ncbi:hypothetical protein D3C87_2191580 [compost metagenome]